MNPEGGVRCRLGLHRWNCVVAWGDEAEPYREGEERCERCPKLRRFRYRPRGPDA